MREEMRRDPAVSAGGQEERTKAEPVLVRREESIWRGEGVLTTVWRLAGCEGRQQQAAAGTCIQCAIAQPQHGTRVPLSTQAGRFRWQWCTCWQACWQQRQ